MFQTSISILPVTSVVPVRAACRSAPGARLTDAPIPWGPNGSNTAQFRKVAV
jgi:hypothetical protein